MTEKLVEELFSRRAPVTHTIKVEEKAPLSEAQKKQKSRRNLKVYDEAYFDIRVLSQIKDMTQNDLLRWLVKNAVKDLSEENRALYEGLRSKHD